MQRVLGAGVTPLAQARVDSATKGAVDNPTRSRALGPRRIGGVGVAPDLATEGMRGLGRARAAPFLARTPLGRFGQPAEIACVFVVSADGGWVTGETVQVGGSHGARGSGKRRDAAIARRGASVASDFRPA